MNGSTMTLGTVASRLGKRWRMIAMLVLPAVVLSAIAAKVTPRQWTADSAMMISTRDVTIPELRAVLSGPAVGPTGESATVRNEIAILSSRTLIRAAAEKAGLDKFAEFNPWLEERGFLDSLFDDARQPTADELALAVEYRVLRALKVSNDGRNYAVNLTFTSRDPRLSANFLNTLMSLYVQQQTQQKVAANQDANSSLNERAQQLRRELNDADAKVSQFAQKNRIVDSKVGAISEQQLSDLNTQLSIARADRVAAEARSQQAPAAEAVNSAAIAGLRQQEAQLAAKNADLATRFGPTHPDRATARAQLGEIRSAIGAETGKIAGSLRSQVAAAQQREQQLTARIAELQGPAQAASSANADYQRLRADADSKRQIYAELQTRIAQTAKPSDPALPDARVISAAVAPSVPSGPKTTLYVVVAAMLSGMVAIGIALAMDLRDRGFSSLEEIRRLTGLPALGAIPDLRRRHPPHEEVIGNPTGLFAEALRTIRLRLRTVFRNDPPRTLLFTSSVQGEGKTTAALCFALLAARDGRRVLLLDADLRRPGVLRHLPKPQTYDLIDVLGGQVPWTEALMTDPRSGLRYLGAAGPSDEAASLIESEVFERLIGEAAGNFDLVVIDAPPLLGTADAALLARMVEMVILIVAWTKTQRRVVRAAVQQLADEGVPVGVALNRVDPRHTEMDLYTAVGFEPQIAWVNPEAPKLVGRGRIGLPDRSEDDQDGNDNRRRSGRY